MSDQAKPGVILRMGLTVVQGVIGLFGAGSVIVGAHKLFLRYYANEWAGIQISGVNGCAGEDMVANGDLIGSQTFCNKWENFVPWIEIYQHHWQAACLYYGAALAIIVLVGIVWSILQRNLASTTPFGGPPTAPVPSESEHLR